MMPFRLPRLCAFILARAGPGAICAAFFLCFSAAWAQSIPQGYVATREGDVLVMRPSGAADPDITIRIYPTVADADDAGAVVRRWEKSHPLARVDPSALRLQSQTLSGVSSLQRIWKDGALTRQEFIFMPQVGPGRYQPVVARMPSLPGDLLKKHGEAAARVVALIKLGVFQPPAVTAAPVEPAGKRTAPGRPAPARDARAERQATTEQLARSAAEIEAVGFMNSTEMGVGGFTYSPKPVALFRSGDALLEIGNLIRATSLEADRSAHPRDWSRWRRTAGGIELLQGDRWKKLDYPKTMQPSTAGFVLSGDYQRLTGGGDTYNGNMMVAAQSRYTFRPDGKFSCHGFTAVTGNDTFVSSPHAVMEGRYRVDGYLLRLEPTGGQPEAHLIVVDPTYLGVIWIDGPGYTRAD